MSHHGCPERLSNRPKGFEDGPSQATMEVLVETLTGTAFEMTVSPSDTIFAIKSKIFRVEGIPVSQQHLLYNLKELEDASSLRELAIADGARLKLVLGLRGGPISTRRLPPPPAADAPWRDIERLLDSSREEGAWGGAAGGGGGGGAGCKVTVLVFRDGERYNMLRVRENDDGSYSPIDQAKSESSSWRSLEASDDGLSGSVQENALTMGKMLELRRRMESMALQRRRLPSGHPVSPIQKTRSEETLAVHTSAASRLARATDPPRRAAPPRTDRPDRPDRADRTDRTDTGEDRWGLALARPLAALLADDDELCVQPDASLASLPHHDCGPLVVRGGWRVRGFGSASQLVPPRPPPPPAARRLAPLPPLPPLPPLADTLLSASTSDLERLARPPAARLLPALSRHRNRSQLHLSDEGLDRRGPPGPPGPHGPHAGCERRHQHQRVDRVAELHALSTRSLFEEVLCPSPTPAPAPPPVAAAEAGAEGEREGKAAAGEEAAGGGARRPRCEQCRKRLSIATQHTCRCGGRFCAPHRYAEAHGCAHDYKAEARAPAPPALRARKLPDM